MKCGPDECPIRIFSDLTRAEQRIYRKREAERLANEGFTQAQIAKTLGVSRETITKDLDGLVIDTKPQRPKGGRPKGAGAKRQRKIPQEIDQAAAILVLDHNKTQKQTLEELDIDGTEQVIKTAVAREEGRREMFADILDAAAAENFSDKGKFRIEDAIRVHKSRLDRAFEQRVNDEVRRRIESADDAARASNKALRLENISLQRIVQERGVFTELQFKHLLMLTHADDPLSPALKTELLQVLLKNKIRLVKSDSTAKVI